MQKYIGTDIVGKLLGLLDVSSESIRINAGWILSNFVAVSSHLQKELLNIKIHRKLLEMMREGSEELQEQCLWLISNIIGDSIEARDELLGTDLVDQIANILNKGTGRVSTIETVAWTISNLTKKSPPPYKQVIHNNS
jgi:hypothetical protein